jgi:uncharacterized protein YbjT (DUF2867 family)
MYVILGASGNTGKHIAQTLLEAGKPVTLVSRNAAHLQELVGKGAIAAIGDQMDEAFLIQTLTGATAAYLLIPPDYTATDFRAYQKKAGEVIAAAVQKSGLKNTILLSSVGAHLSENSGVILGLHWLEQKLKAMPGLNTLALRPGFFMQNFYGSIGIIKGMNINGGFPIDGEMKFGMIHTNDIAAYAAKRLLALDFQGFSYQNLTGERELSLREATAALGEAIGKPELPWVTFPYDQAKAGMVQSGMTESLADLYVEFGKCMNEGSMTADHKHTPESKTPTSIETFAREFAYAFQA